jgi:two-component system response regulator YesN
VVSLIKLLIADDEATVREYIKFVIQEHDIPVKIEEAANGVEAVEKAIKFRPDLLLMDIRMPLRSGLRAASSIKRSLKDVKIAILTAYDEFDYAREALQIGVSEYLLKPISPKELLEFFQRALQEKETSTHDGKGFLKGTLDFELKLLEHIKLGERRKALKALNALLENEKIKEYDGQQLKQYFVELTGMIIRTAASLNMDIDELERLKENSQNKILVENSVKALNRYVKEFVFSISDLIEKHYMSPNEKIVLKAKAYIKSNYNSKIELLDVAKHVNLSPYYFSRLFKSQTGMNFVEYLNRFRIEKAKEYIRNKDLSLKEISEMVGYENLSYFSSVFVRYAGCLPSLYKKNLQDNE